MSYDLYTNYMYIPGMYFCVKKIFFLTNLLNEKLFWGESEDIEWSKRVRKQTVFKINTYSLVKYLKQKPVDWSVWLENEKKLNKLLNRGD